MKRFVLCFTVLSLSMALGGCNKNKQDENSDVGIVIEDNAANEIENTQEASDDSGISVNIDGKEVSSDKKNSASSQNNSAEAKPKELVLTGETVDIYFPASAFKGASKEAIEKQALSLGSIATVNDDGSVIYKMEKKTQEKMITDLKEGVLGGIQVTLNSEGKPSFLKDIKINDDFTKVDIYVDKADYEKNKGDFTYEAISNNCLGYQTFNQIQPDKLQVEVNLIEQASGNTFASETVKGE